MLEAALFATLPLALFSFLTRSRGVHAGLGFLGALAPVIASAVGGIFGRRGQRSREQEQIDFQRQQAEQEEAQRRAAFEAQQQSPQAAMQRLAFNTRLARILGGFGGRESTPGFIQRAFDTARMPQEYTPGGEFIAPPTRTGGGFTDYLGDILSPRGAAGYFDVQRFNRGRTRQRANERYVPVPEQIEPGQLDLGPQAQTQSLLPSAIRARQFDIGAPPPDPLRSRGRR
jgi:hypothetical protein